MLKPALLRASLLFCFTALACLPAFSQSVTVSPTSISFGNQAKGTTSPVHKVTLKNGQTSAITITSISTSLADFGETNNCPMSPATLKAGASCTISVTFTPSIQGGESGTLTVVDTGLDSPQLVTLTGTGTAPILESIAVTPSTASIIVGNTQQFTATGTYSDGSTQNLTTSVSWVSSATLIATIGLHTGLAKGVAAGAATITASLGTVKNTASLTITAAVLTSISVTPATGSVEAGKTQQFTATGTYNNGTAQNLSDSAIWTSSATSIATVNSTGLATSIKVGTATITAASGTISDSATLTVTAAVLTSIAVTPSTASIGAASTQQFTATGTYSDGSTKNLTTSASWTSSSTAIATVGLHTGLAAGVTAGTVTITANSGKIAGTATLTVTAMLTSIAVTPSTASIAAGYTQQFTATGTYSDGSTQNLTTSASWTSSATSVATVSAGLASGVAQGSATITATSGTISGSATLTVTAPVLTSIAVTPSTASIASGTTQQFTATGTYSDGSTQNLTSTATWSSSTTAVATIAAGGLATSVSVGTSTITATSGSISGTVTLTVSPAALVSIAVTPANPSFAMGTTLQLIATGTYSDGSTLDLTTTATWSSANQAIATVNGQGIASSVATGSTSITATLGTISGAATVTVTTATLVSIAVTPAIPTLPLGITQQFTATGTFSDGSTQNIMTTVQWSSDTPTVAMIGNAGSTIGLATTVLQGTANISATSGSISGSTKLTVTSASLVSIAVTPATPSIAPGTMQQLTATGTYSDGSTQNLTSTATWSSDTPSTATINSAGLATSVAAGTATISATPGSIIGSTLLTVTSATLTSIAINPSTATIALGTTQQFTATGTFSDGTTQNLTQTGHWSSGAGALATISNTSATAGLTNTLGAGTITINFSLGSASSSATLAVNPVTLASIAMSPQNPAITLGATQQFTATGTFSDNSTQDLTSTVTWNSSAATIAIVGNTVGSYGLATSSGQGTATISASSGPVTASTALTVAGPVLVSIAINPQNPTIASGTTQQFTATGTYSDGSTEDLTTTAIWSSSNAAAASISNTPGSNGLATGVAAGSATISATSGTITGSTTLTVSGPALVSIAITPPNPSVPLGTTQQFTATGTYSDNSTQNITSSVTWSSSDQAIATISNSAGSNGLATSTGQGTAIISATLNSISGSTTLTVTAGATLVSITLSPLTPLISLGANEQFTATGNFSDGSTLNITNSVTWSSSATTVATISNSAGTQGLATSVSEGTTTITAALGVSASTQLTVVAAGAWTLHGPPGRQSHSEVWDPNSRQMIIFGGQQAVTNTNLNDVWLGTTSTSQNDSFISESPTGTAPQGRYGHVATYDPNSNQMTIFGGAEGTSFSCGNDLWILSGANGESGTPNWISVSPTGTAPAARVYSAGVYDPTTNSMIIFGGGNCAGSFFSDVWVLSNANGETGTPAWTQLAPSGTAPAARESGTAVYDSVNNILIIYGGDAGRTLFGDVWVLSFANGTGGTPAWTKLLPSGSAPMARTGHTAIFDSVNDRMTIFGGTNASGITFSDAWVLTSANGIGGTPDWTQIPAQGTTPSLAYHTAVYDQATDSMYVFAGSSSQDKLQANNHAFTLSGANGISSSGEKWILGGPAVRYSHSAFYDSVTNGLFIFAGQHSQSAVNFNDYWEESPAIGSSNLQWTLVGSAGSKPSARFGHTGLYDSGSNRMMVFGGATGFPAPCANDYYILKQANNQGGGPTWLSINASGTHPGVRTRHVSVYDKNTNTIVIFGGYDCNLTYYSDVWILQNANDVSGQPTWIQLQPTGTAPTARESASAIYDPTTNSLVVYGGDAGGELMGDIWILSNANGTGGTPAWTQLSPSASGPVPRSGQTATYDSTNNIMTIYGGFDGTNILGDTWVLSGANGQAGPATWTQLVAGQIRRFHSSNYDPVSNELITFGGATGASGAQNPVADVYSLTDANNIP